MHSMGTQSGLGSEHAQVPPHSKWLAIGALRWGGGARIAWGTPEKVDMGCIVQV